MLSSLAAVSTAVVPLDPSAPPDGAPISLYLRSHPPHAVCCLPRPLTIYLPHTRRSAPSIPLGTTGAPVASCGRRGGRSPDPAGWCANNRGHAGGDSKGSACPGKPGGGAGGRETPTGRAWAWARREMDANRGDGASDGGGPVVKQEDAAGGGSAPGQAGAAEQVSAAGCLDSLRPRGCMHGAWIQLPIRISFITVDRPGKPPPVLAGAAAAADAVDGGRLDPWGRSTGLAHRAGAGPC